MQVFVNFNFSLYFKYFLYLKKKTRYQVGWVILQAGWGSTYQDSNFSFFKLICFLTFFGQKQVCDTAGREGRTLSIICFINCLSDFFLAINRWVIRQAGSEGITLSRFLPLLLNQFIVRLFFCQKPLSDTAWREGLRCSNFSFLSISFFSDLFLAKNRWVIRQGGREALIFSITKKIIFRSIICQTFFAKNRWVIRQAGGEALTWPSAIPLSRPTALPPNIWVGKKGFNIWDLVKISWINWGNRPPLNYPWSHKLERTVSGLW